MTAATTAPSTRSPVVTLVMPPNRKPGQVAGEGPAAADDQHAQRQHPDEEQADRGVLVEPRTPADERDAAHHHACAQEALRSWG